MWRRIITAIKIHKYELPYIKYYTYVAVEVMIANVAIINKRKFKGKHTENTAHIQHLNEITRR